MRSTTQKVKIKTRSSRAANRLLQEPIAAARAKTEFLGLIERVSAERRAVTITKRGKPLVRIVPIDNRLVEDPFGCMKGSVKTVGDIVGAEPDIWEAMA